MTTLNKKTGVYAGEARVVTHAATHRLRHVRRLLLTSGSVLALTVLSAETASAQWAGTVSSDWTNPANWTGGTVPNAASNILISPISGVPAILGVNGPAVGTTANLAVGGPPGNPGNLTIQNGSTLTSNGTLLQIGRSAGANGFVTVTGTGSNWITSGSALIVGNGGNGTLNIVNGGLVTAQNGVTVASAVGSTGTLNIGSGGVLETTFLQGGAGTAQLNFDGGTIRALAGNTNFMNLASTIGPRGLTLDTNGFTIGVRDIGGAGGLTITGGGTVTLPSGTNTYTGETWIQAGSTLRPSFGAIANSSRVIVDGTFNLTSAAPNTNIQSLAGSGSVTTLAARNLILTNANDIFFGDISGGGNVRVTGGTQTFGAAQSYTGGTFVSGTGTLRAGAANVFSTASAYTAQAGGTFDLNGFDQTIASLSNAGTVRTGGAPGTTLTVTGNYIGNGGTVHLNTSLGGDASPTDRLVVQGDTSGSSMLRVTNIGGTGAQTISDIKVVDVQGASNGAFALQGNYSLHGQQAVVGGAYAYMLYQGSMAAPGDGDWYLRSQLINPPAGAPAGPIYQAGVPLYEAYPQVLLGLNGLSTMQQRVGDRYNNSANAFASAAAPTYGDNTQIEAWWGRMEGWHGHIDPRNSTAGTTNDTDQARIQTGLDGQLAENAAGRLMTSLYLQYGTAQSKVRSFFGDGTIKVEGYSVAGTLTWLGNNGFYVDAQAQVTFFDTSLYSQTSGYNVVSGDDPKGYALGIETGWRLPMGGAWSLTPQAQLVYSKVDFDFADVFGTAVTLNKGDSLTGRGGLAAEYQSAWIDPSRGLINTSVYGIANLYYEFLDGTATNVAGVSFANAADRLWGGIGGGGSYAWANGKYALYAEALVTTSLDNFSDSYGYKGTAGFKMKW